MPAPQEGAVQITHGAFLAQALLQAGAARWWKDAGMVHIHYERDVCVWVLCLLRGPVGHWVRSLLPFDHPSPPLQSKCGTWSHRVWMVWAGRADESTSAHQPSFGTFVRHFR